MDGFGTGFAESCGRKLKDIDEVNYKHKLRQEYSIKRASDFASKFLTKYLGIAE